MLCRSKGIVKKNDCTSKSVINRELKRNADTKGKYSFQYAKIFFTHPYCSWEKGQVENMNKLIKQYVTKNNYITKNNINNH